MDGEVGVSTRPAPAELVLAVHLCDEYRYNSLSPEKKLAGLPQGFFVPLFHYRPPLQKICGVPKELPVTEAENSILISLNESCFRRTGCLNWARPGLWANLDPQNKNEEKSTTKSTKDTKGRSSFLSSFVFLVYFVVKFFFIPVRVKFRSMGAPSG
ncbi:hypothetical protein ACYULU_16430 [Breznakiellaceae bacterium SP9]